jgi:hypothetical protein
MYDLRALNHKLNHFIGQKIYPKPKAQSPKQKAQIKKKLQVEPAASLTLNHSSI